MNKLKICPLCGTHQSFSFFLEAKNRYKPTDSYSYHKCENCDVVLLDDRENNNDFIAYNLTEKPSAAQNLVMWLFQRRLKKNKKQGKLLDFGAGSGNLSQYLKNNGYDVDAYEVDETSKHWLREKRGINVVANFRENYYDAIIMEQVLEHLPNPRETLEQLKRSLKKDGVFLISLPNINSTQARIFKAKWFHLDAPRHLNHFYGNSFAHLTKSLNLKIVRSHYFNFHMDLTGWYWSLNNRNCDLGLKNLAISALFSPLLLLTTLTKSTAYVLYVLRHE